MNRRTGIVAGIVLLIVVLTGAFYVARNPERATLDDAARRTAPGKFVRLGDGVTHYVVDGPDTGRTVVLVHGFSVPLYIWDSTAAALSHAGYRVIRYDEYGRGWSDRPDAVYDADLYDRQLGQLLDSLHVPNKVDLAGVSMGGYVAATFAGRHASRVNTLTLVDPVSGPAAAPTGMFYLPIAGPYLFQLLAVPTMAQGQTSDFIEPSRFPDWVDRYRPQMRYRGFGRALLSSRRAMAGVNLDSVYRTVDRADVPTLILWGTADRTVPFARSARVRIAIPLAEFHPIDGAAHLPIVERAAVADSLILQFLARHPQ